MNNNTFKCLVEQMQKNEMELLITKGQEYTRSDEDRLVNFKRCAKELGITSIQALMVYLQKHLDSIYNYVKTGQTFSTETIHSRISDARNYLILLDALIIEQEQVNEKAS